MSSRKEGQEDADDPITAETGVVELDRAEGRALVDGQARELLGMSVDEFIAFLSPLRRTLSWRQREPHTHGNTLDAVLANR